MPFWENEDGTFSYLPLVTYGEMRDATVDNQENSGRTERAGNQEAGAASSSGSRAVSTARTTPRRYGDSLNNRRFWALIWGKTGAKPIICCKFRRSMPKTNAPYIIRRLNLHDSLRESSWRLAGVVVPHQGYAAPAFAPVLSLLTFTWQLMYWLQPRSSV